MRKVGLTVANVSVNGQKKICGKNSLAGKSGQGLGVAIRSRTGDIDENENRAN
jgi:hypothetical protein